MTEDKGNRTGSPAGGSAGRDTDGGPAKALYRVRAILNARARAKLRLARQSQYARAMMQDE